MDIKKIKKLPLFPKTKPCELEINYIETKCAVGMQLDKKIIKMGD